MRNSRKKKKDFRAMLEKYLEIKGLDIVVVLEDGQEVELYKNRSIVDDVIITLENGKGELRIPLSSIKTVDLFAA
jgi:hypothetical protein